MRSHACRKVHVVHVGADHLLICILVNTCVILATSKCEPQLAENQLKNVCRSQLCSGRPVVPLHLQPSLRQRHPGRLAGGYPQALGCRTVYTETRESTYVTTYKPAQHGEGQEDPEVCRGQAHAEPEGPQGQKVGLMA